MSSLKVEGTWVAVVTPLRDDLSVDVPSLRRLLQHQLGSGVSGVVACGSTGEAPTLTEAEYLQVVEVCLSECRNKAPVAAGIGLSSTERALAIGKRAAEAGVQALLVSSPPYNKPTQEGLYRHISSIAEASGLPGIAYNIPGRTGVNIAPATLIRLAREGIIVAIKEASGSLDQMLDVMVDLPVSCSMLAGDDSFVCALMACGGRGTISASANVAPDCFSAMTSAALTGDFVQARRIQLELIPLIRTLFSEPNPIPVKAALKLQGLIESAAVRPPLTSATNPTIERLKQVIGL